MPDSTEEPLPDVIPFDDDLPWLAWSPHQAVDLLREIRTADGRPVRWAVAGGWAIDLFLHRVTREHEDLEIVVLNDDVPCVLDAFVEPAWEWKVPTDGWLHPLTSTAFAETHQTWLWSHAHGAFVLDVFRDDHDAGTWICRREPGLTMPWAAVSVHEPGRAPYLIPEVVLLFKAKHARAKDLRDLEITLPALHPQQRAWLRDAIQRVHPGHDWLHLI